MRIPPTFTVPFNKPGVWPFDPCGGRENQGKLKRSRRGITPRAPKMPACIFTVVAN